MIFVTPLDTSLVEKAFMSMSTFLEAPFSRSVYIPFRVEVLIFFLKFQVKIYLPVAEIQF